MMNKALDVEMFLSLSPPHEMGNVFPQLNLKLLGADELWILILNQTNHHDSLQQLLLNLFLIK